MTLGAPSILARANSATVPASGNGRESWSGNAQAGFFMPDSAPASIEERFWAKVHITDECWLWRGSRYPAGYGRFSPWHRGDMGAHRYAYSMAYGPIPPKTCIMHRCERRHCVRPSHLWAGSYSDRTKAAIAKGRITGPRKHRT